jgi:hypothetical protein
MKWSCGGSLANQMSCFLFINFAYKMPRFIRRGNLAVDLFNHVNVCKMVDFLIRSVVFFAINPFHAIDDRRSPGRIA